MSYGRPADISPVASHLRPIVSKVRTRTCDDLSSSASQVPYPADVDTEYRRAVGSVTILREVSRFMR